MAEYTVGVRLTAHDETGAGTASAQSHLKGVDEAAREANKEIAGMGGAAAKGSSEAVPHLNSLKNALADITKMATGFAIGGLLQQAGGSLVGAIQGSIDKAKEFSGQVKGLQMVMGGTPEEISSTVAAFERFGVAPERAALGLTNFARQIQKLPIDMQEMASNIDEATGKPLKGFAESMRNLGVNTEDTGGKVRPIMDVFLDAADKVKALGNGTEAAGVAATLFGARLGREMLPLLMQGSEGIKAAAAEAAKLGLQLTTSNMAQIKAFSAAGKDLNDAMGGLKLQIGIALMPVLTALASIGSTLARLLNENLLPAIRTVAEWIGNMVKNVQDAWARFMEWLGPLGAVVDVLKDLIANVINATGSLDGLQIVATNAGIAIVGAGAAMTAFSFATTAVSDAMGFLSNSFEVLNAIIDANPIVTVVLILAVLATALYTAYQNVGWFKDIVNALGTALSGEAGAMGVVYDVLKETFGEGVADFLNPFLNWFMNAIVTVQNFMSVIGDFASAIATAFTADAGAMGVVYDLIRKVFGDEAAEAMQPFLQNIMLFIPRIGEFATFLKDKLGAAWKWLTDTALPMFMRVLGVVAGFITHEVLVTLRNFWDWIYPRMEIAVRWWETTAWPVIQGVLKALGDFISGPVVDALTSLWNWLYPKIEEAISWWEGTGWPTLQGVWDAVGAFIDTDFARFMGDLFGWLKGKGEEGVNWWVGEGWPALQKAWEALGSFYLVEVQPKLIDLWHWLQEKSAEALGWWQENGPKFKDAIGKAFQDIAKPDEQGKGILVPFQDAIKSLGDPEVTDALDNFKKKIIFSDSELASIRKLGDNVFWVSAGLVAFGQAIATPLLTDLANTFKILGNTFSDFGKAWKEVFGDDPKTGKFNAAAFVIDVVAAAWDRLKQKVFGTVDVLNTIIGLLQRIARVAQELSTGNYGGALAMLTQGLPNVVNGEIVPGTMPNYDMGINAPFGPGGIFGPPAVIAPTPGRPGQAFQEGGWLREPVVGVGPSGTRYSMHANEFISPPGALASQAAAAHSGNGGSVTLNVGPGAVVINGSGSAADDIAAAADGLWDDLYAKLSRALDNRPMTTGGAF